MKKMLLSCLLVCLNLVANAQVTDLVVHCPKVGQLKNLISEDDQKTVKNLKVTGYVDGEDFVFIGRLMNSYSLDGVLDLSECSVPGNEIDGFYLNKKDSIRVYRIPKCATKVWSCTKNLYVDTLYFDCKVKKVSFRNIWSETNGNTTVGKVDIGHLQIGEGVDTIGNFGTNPGNEWAGEHNSVKSVHMPSSLKYLAGCAFYNCGLTKHNFNDLVNLEYIGTKSYVNWFTVFSGCPLDTIIVPSKLAAYPVGTVPYERGAHIFIGPNTTNIIGGPSNKRNSEGITFHINQKTPPNYSSWFYKETIYVPKGAKSAYENAGWDATIIEMNPVEKVVVSEHEIVMDKGQQHGLSVTITPENADDMRIKWSSVYDSIASVNEGGTITAVNSGQTIIYATSIATGIKDSCLVTVRKNVKSVTFDNPQVVLSNIGDSQQLRITIAPADATEKSVSWKSSNEQVCIVSASGLVTATGIGSAVITVTTADGGFEATCVVKVLQHVTGLNIEKNSMSLKVGENELLRAKVNPENADDKAVKWSSSNEFVATVDTTGNVKALKPGETWIKAISVDNAEAKDSCKVTVTQPVTGITISQEAIKLTNIGENKQLEATVLPEDASNKEVKWKSSNESICMVANGKVIATGFGTAVVMVTTVDGGFMASCTVTVESENTSIESVDVSVSDNPVYNMMGRKVTVLEKGRLYIRNGKKFIAK